MKKLLTALLLLALLNFQKSTAKGQIVVPIVEAIPIAQATFEVIATAFGVELAESMFLNNERENVKDPTRISEYPSHFFKKMIELESVKSALEVAVAFGDDDEIAIALSEAKRSILLVQYCLENNYDEPILVEFYHPSEVVEQAKKVRSIGWQKTKCFDESRDSLVAEIYICPTDVMFIHFDSYERTSGAKIRTTDGQYEYKNEKEPSRKNLRKLLDIPYFRECFIELETKGNGTVFFPIKNAYINSVTNESKNVKLQISIEWYEENKRFSYAFEATSTKAKKDEIFNKISGLHGCCEMWW